MVPVLFCFPGSLLYTKFVSAGLRTMSTLRFARRPLSMRSLQCEEPVFFAAAPGFCDQVRIFTPAFSPQYRYGHKRYFPFGRPASSCPRSSPRGNENDGVVASSGCTGPYLFCSAFRPTTRFLPPPAASPLAGVVACLRTLPSGVIFVLLPHLTPTARRRGSFG